MWVITQHGFVSAVRHRTQKDYLMVRARDKQSLEELVTRAQTLADSTLKVTDIYTDFPSDYPFRVCVTDAELTHALLVEVGEIQYANFKDQVTKTRGKLWHDALMRVWSAMRSVTPDSVRAENANAWSKYSAKYTTKGKGKKGKKGKGSALADTLPVDWTRYDDAPVTKTYDLDETTDAELLNKDLHALTDEEWRQLMEQGPSN